MEIRVLGPLALAADDRRWEISGSRQQTVLALLSLEPGRPVSQDQLIEAVWGDSSPASAVATLHSCVYRIRKVLESAGFGELLRRGPWGYALDVPAPCTDANRFEDLVACGRRALDAGDAAEASARLREALGLWQGEAFEGVETPAVRERAAGLSELRLDATEWSLTADVELGRHQAIVVELETLTGEHPYREGLWELLMTALYRSGRQAAALEAYQRLYRLLDDELGIQPSAPLRELQQRILAGEPDRSPAAGKVVVPRLLPARVRDFTGRESQLKALDGLLPSSGDGAMPIATLAGTAGVGKTALAVHWAHQVSDRFPDGQLYVNLRGFSLSGDPLPVGEAVRRFLDALGVPAERVPADPDAQAALYRSLLADRRMLVVLDNAADEEQVRPLLPASLGCFVLVTSRSRMQGLVAAEAAYPISLDLLGDADAELLLVRRLGPDRLAAEPAAVGELVERCARLPLALASVAGRAAANPDLSLGEIASQLGGDDNLDVFSGTDPATDLRVVFSWSLHQVTPAAARLFRLLGLDPGTEIGVPATASLLGATVEETQPLLAELCDAHLLIELRPGRYVFHDLLCAYAYELGTTEEPEAEQAAATLRIFDHYLHTAHAAILLLDPDLSLRELTAPGQGTVPEELTDATHAREWLETERVTLLETVEEANNIGFHAHALRLAHTLSEFLHRRAHWRDQIACLLGALTAARQLNDSTAEARSHRQLAGPYIRIGSLDLANAHLEQALSMESDDPVEKAKTLMHLSALLPRQDRHREAIGYAQEALDLFRAHGRSVGEVGALNQIGWFLAQLGEYQDALAYCEEALTVSQEFGITYALGATLDSIGYINHQLGEHHRAADYFEQAVAHLSERGDRYALAEALTHLGDARLAAGDSSSARENWQAALAILDELGHSDAGQVRAKLAG